MSGTKRLIEDDTCLECGADMSENHNGELECDKPDLCSSHVRHEQEAEG